MVAKVRAWILSRPLSWWVVFCVALLYAMYFSVYTVQRHNAFLTSGWDLGNFDQAIWNTAHGRPFAMSNLPDVTVRFAHHVEPILLLIAPLYWFWSDVRLLLILQSFAIGFSALPLYTYAARRVGQWAAVLLSVAYLMLPALQGVNTFDFHAVALAPLFLLLAWNWLDEGKTIPFTIAAVLAAGTKEEISLLVAMMGLYALLVQRRRFGVVPFVAGVAWFLLAIQVISPAFNQTGQHEFLGYYGQWGNSAVEVLLSMITRPLEVITWLATPPRSTYIVDLLLPTLGLALVAPQVLLIAAPSLAVNLLSTFSPMTDLVGYHYPAPILPFVAVAAATGLGTVAKRFIPNPRYQTWFCTGIVALMLVVTLVQQRQAGATPLAEDWVYPTVTPHHQIGERLLATIPATAAVSAQSPINPHLSQREQIFRYPDGQADAEYLVFDITVPDLFVHPNDLKADIIQKFASNMWGIAQAEDGWLVLERCTPTSVCRTALPDAFFSYARVANPAPQFVADIQYGDALRLTGYDLLEQGKETQVRFYWQALRPITESLRPFPLFFDTSWSTVLEDTNTRPLMETVWYLPQDWKVGETVQTTTLPWTVSENYNLVMAVLADGTAPEGARLPVTLGNGSAIPQIAKENAPTLLRVRDNAVEEAGLRQDTLLSGASERAERLGDTIQLAGVTLQSEAKIGYTVDVTLFWQADTPLPADYTAFVQILGPNGVITQSDQFPITVLDQDIIPRPTTGWAQHEVVADRHTLRIPPETPAGEYEVVVGLYDLANNAKRLPATLNGEHIANDAIVIGTVRVIP